MSDMNKETVTFVTAKTNELLATPMVYAGLKETAQAWLAAVNTAKESDATKKYIADLKECITPIDGLIAFAESAHGAQILGTEGAKKMAAHAKEIKADGAKYCDCPACAAALAIVEKLQ
jgi:hypothetical protein